MHGLNLYDYSARYYESGIGRFTGVDPYAEMYYSWSPYTYVGNNPIKRIDPTGRVWEEPVNWLGIKDISSQGSPKGDRKFYLFAHGSSHTVLLPNGIWESDPKKISDVIGESNPEWKKAMDSGEVVTLYLYSCNSGTEGNMLVGHDAGIGILPGTSDPIGKRMAETFKNVVIVAFEGQVVYNIYNGKIYGIRSHKKDAGAVIYSKDKKNKQTKDIRTSYPQEKLTSKEKTILRQNYDYNVDKDKYEGKPDEYRNWGPIRRTFYDVFEF